MDFVSPLYNALQAQAHLEGTRATTQDTQALAQMRGLALVLQQQQAQRNQMMAEQLQKSPSFTNATGPATPGAGNPPPPQPNLFGVDFDANDPLVESLRNAREGVNLTKQRIDMAQQVGDVPAWTKATQDHDNQQKEYRLAQVDVMKESERRNKEAAQAFGSVETADDLKAALQYVNDNVSKKQARAIAGQLVKTLPNLDNATPEQIQAAVDPIRNRYATMGEQLRFRGSMQASADRADSLEQRKFEANRKAAGAQAGVKYDEMTPEEQQQIDFYSQMQLMGDVSWRTGLGRNKSGSKMIEDIDRRTATLAKELDLKPSDVVANKGETAALLKTIIDRQKYVSAGNQFVRNMQSQADLVDKYMDKGTIDGSPAISKWIQAGRKSVVGDPNVSALDTAIRGLAREHQRIVTGVTSNAQLHVSAQETADQLLNVAQTPDQMRAVIGVMREEADNAVKAGRDEIADLKKRIKSNAPQAAGAAAEKSATLPNASAAATETKYLNGVPVNKIGGVWTNSKTGEVWRDGKWQK